MGGKRILIIVVAALVCTAIVGGAALAASSGPPGRLAATEGLPSGVGYRLTSLAWDVDGTVSGPGYRLGGTIDGTGTPCCRDYLPCILRRAP